MPMLRVLPTNVRNILANLRKHHVNIMALEATPILLVFNAFSEATIPASLFDSSNIRIDTKSQAQQSGMMYRTLGAELYPSQLHTTTVFHTTCASA
jgi:hypothetical protein